MGSAEAGAVDLEETLVDVFQRSLGMDAKRGRYARSD
jgi:hypothetical protein